MKHMIRYTIDGVFECEAASHAEAQEMFEALTKEELAEIGDLTADEPMTEEEYEAEITLVSTGAASPA